MSKLPRYRKSIVAAIAVLLTGVNILYGTNAKVQMLISVATLLGVYQVPNTRR